MKSYLLQDRLSTPSTVTERRQGTDLPVREAGSEHLGIPSVKLKPEDKVHLENESRAHGAQPPDTTKPREYHIHKFRPS